MTNKLLRIMWAAIVVLAALPPAHAQTFTIIATFSNIPGPGTSPLARDTEGNLFGTSFSSILKIDPTGKVTTLYTFKGAPDGYAPVQVVLDPEGNLYGTTEYGGTGSCSNGPYPGCGTVFKLTPAGEETVLHSFKGSPDGAWPYAGLIRDTSGNLYGTTYFGGSATGTCFGSGCGTVFKIDPAGKETILHRFNDEADGGLPLGNLLLADGVLYGTTAAGGTGPCKNSYNPIVGCGTVFKLVGHKETVLHSFQGPDGYGPDANVVRDTEGNLYGTTVAGGDAKCNGDLGCGVLFKLAPDGKETLVHTFKDQNLPEGVVIDPKGVIYGSVSGRTSPGDVFQVDSSGQYSVLYTISAQGIGGPGDLTLDDQGNLYGSGISVVFKLTP